MGKYVSARKRQEIKQCLKVGGFSRNEIAEAYGVSAGFVSMMKREMAYGATSSRRPEIKENWTSLVREYDEVTGVSLQRLLDRDLYPDFARARDALLEGGFNAVPVRYKRGEDFVFLDLVDAREYCLRARTKAGDRLAALLLEGFESAQRPGASDPVDPVDWGALVVEAGGAKGISLRRLTDAGMFASFEEAKRALAAEGFSHTATIDEGREDVVLTDFIEAQMFCATVRSEAGRRILHTLVEHSRLITDALEGSHRPALAVEDDPIEALINEHARKLAELEDRLDSISQVEEDSEAAEDEDGAWVAPTQLARRIGLLSKASGRYHAIAAGEIARSLGYEPRVSVKDRGDGGTSEFHHYPEAAVEPCRGYIEDAAGGAAVFTIRPISSNRYCIRTTPREG